MNSFNFNNFNSSSSNSSTNNKIILIITNNNNNNNFQIMKIITFFKNKNKMILGFAKKFLNFAVILSTSDVKIQNAMIKSSSKKPK